MDFTVMAGGVVPRILNAVLAAELRAIQRYFACSRRCDQSPCARIHVAVRRHSVADRIINRLVGLSAVPHIEPGPDEAVPLPTPCEGLLAEGAEQEELVSLIRSAVGACAREGDDESRDLLVEILRVEEEHLRWLDAERIIRSRRSTAEPALH